MDKPTHILLLEDNVSDAGLVKRELRKAGLDSIVLLAQDKASFLAALGSFAPDLVLADYTLPGFDGLIALAFAHQQFPEIPVIIVSGAIGEEIAIEALKAGATDYVLKQRLNRLGPVVQRALQEAQQIAERKQAEALLAERSAALRESEERFRLLVEAVQDYAILMLDPEGHITSWNTGAERIKGWAAHEVLGQHFALFYLPQDRESGLPQRALAMAAAQGRYEGQGQRLCKDGSLFWADVVITALHDDAGQLRGFAKITRDITERKQAEAALIESEERFRSISDFTYDWELWIDPHGRIVYISPSCERVTGRPARAYIEDPSLLFNIVHPEDREAVVAHHCREQDSPNPAAIDFRILTPDGQVRWIAHNCQPVIAPDGRSRGRRISNRDVTDRRRSEEQALQYQARLEVNRQLIEQREQERQQIARDLHDGPVQELTGATFALRGLLMDECAPAVAAQLEAIQETLQAQINELRAYAGELRPPTLAKFGLVKAIQSHLEGFREKHPGLQVVFKESQASGLLPGEMRLVFFRIYQEALANTAKHSRATQVTIRFKKTPEQAVLEIQDNGAGFAVPKDWLELAHHGHLGLVGMRERAEAIDGTLTVVSQPNQGTKIQVIIPIQREGVAES